MMMMMMTTTTIIIIIIIIDSRLGTNTGSTTLSQTVQFYPPGYTQFP